MYAYVRYALYGALLFCGAGAIAEPAYSQLRFAAPLWGVNGYAVLAVMGAGSFLGSVLSLRWLSYFWRGEPSDPK